MVKFITLFLTLPHFLTSKWYKKMSERKTWHCLEHDFVCFDTNDELHWLPSGFWCPLVVKLLQRLVSAFKWSSVTWKYSKCRFLFMLFLVFFCWLCSVDGSTSFMRFNEIGLGCGCNLCESWFFAWLWWGNYMLIYRFTCFNLFTHLELTFTSLLVYVFTSLHDY